MNPLLGIITLFAGNFAPRGWAFCNGQLLSIAQNTALFSLLGTMYGGDGRTTFGLPDLRGRVLIHPGSGPGLSTYRVGNLVGVNNVTLNESQLPMHSHSLIASNSPGTVENPSNGILAKDLVAVARNNSISANSFRNESPVAMANTAISPSGGNQPHPNLMPILGLNYIIALEGIYPSRA